MNKQQPRRAGSLFAMLSAELGFDAVSMYKSMERSEKGRREIDQGVEDYIRARPTKKPCP
jgi:hypothetical protein